MMGRVERRGEERREFGDARLKKRRKSYLTACSSSSKYACANSVGGGQQRFSLVVFWPMPK